MAIIIDLQDYCYGCERSNLNVGCSNDGAGRRDETVYCRQAPFCNYQITRLRLDRLEKSVNELKEKEK